MADEDTLKLMHYIIHLDKMIGKGAFGKVYDCTDIENKNKELCAKIITEKIDDEKTLREINLMKELKEESRQNTNIVGIELVEITAEQIIIILDKCECDLQKQMDDKKRDNITFTPLEATNIIGQIINGYKVLYHKSIIHRDMKPANILYKKGLYKIADFGLARVADQMGKHTKVGTPKYAAPQLFFEPTFTSKSDIFSLGIMYYELIFGKLPFKANNQQDIRRALKALQSTPIVVDRSYQGITQEIANLIEFMVQYSETQRISWDQLFNHPLFKKVSDVQVNESQLLGEVDEDEEEEEEPQKQQQEQLNTTQPIPQFNQPVTQTPFQVQQQQPQQQQQTQQTQQLQQQSQTQQQPQSFQQTFFTPVTQGNFSQTSQFPKLGTQTKFQTPTQLPQQPMVQPAGIIPAGSGIKPFPPNTLQNQFPVPQFHPPAATPWQAQNQLNGLQIQQTINMSDQLFQIAQFCQAALEMIEKYFNIQLNLMPDHVNVKIIFLLLTECFFEHTKPKKQQSNTGLFNLNQVDEELKKIAIVRSNLVQEIQYMGLGGYCQLQPVTADYLGYFQRLFDLLSNSRLFPYINDKKYFAEYLQLIYLFEKLKDIKTTMQSFSTLYNGIVQITKSYTNEKTIRDYLRTKY